MNEPGRVTGTIVFHMAPTDYTAALALVADIAGRWRNQGWNVDELNIEFVVEDKWD